MGSITGGLDEDQSAVVITDSGAVNEHVKKARDAFKEHMQVQSELGLLSDSEIQQQQSFIDNLSDPKDIKEALQAYASTEGMRLLEENVNYYNEKFLKPLDIALKEEKIISQKSYDEWMAWTHDRSRNSPDKKTSIEQVLPEYLRERRELAKERENLISKRKQLDEVTTPKLKKEIEFLRNKKEWFETISFSQRENLIDRIKAGLAVEKGGDTYKELFNRAEKILMNATAKPQPALHRDKVGTWLKRIFESGATPKQIEAFITGKGHTDGKSLPELIYSWRDIAVQFWIIRDDPAFDGVKKEFINTKAFLYKHYDERTEYIGIMKNQRNRAKVLRSQAMSRLDMPHKSAWINEHLFNGEHTLGDLESIINGDLAKHLEPIQDYMDGQKDGEEKDEDVYAIEADQSDAAKVDDLIDSIESPAVRAMCMQFCHMGYKYIKAFAWTSYNREWCNKNGYLTLPIEQNAIRDGKEQALMKQREKQTRGAVSETIQGETGEEEFVKLSRSAATNVCIDLSDAGAIAAYRNTMRRNVGDARALYWTNAIFHFGGSLMSRDQQREMTWKMYKMRNVMKKMESKGQYYKYGGTSIDLAHKAKAVSAKKPKRSQTHFAS